jgi:glycine cleavage system H protein
MAYVDLAVCELGTDLFLDVRGSRVPHPSPHFLLQNRGAQPVMARRTPLFTPPARVEFSVQGTSPRIGITAYAAEKLGDVVFVELPPWSVRRQRQDRGRDRVHQSVGELFAPVDGTVSPRQVNDAVVVHPESREQRPQRMKAGCIKVSFTELPTPVELRRVHRAGMENGRGRPA